MSDTPNPDTKMLQTQWRHLHAEVLLAECSAVICGLMLRCDIGRKELADLLGDTEKAVDHLLSGKKDITLHRLADVTYALGSAVHLSIRPRIGDGPPIVRAKVGDKDNPG